MILAIYQILTEGKIMDKITASVGKNGKNIKQDVELIQTLLNGCDMPGEDTPLVVDGLVGNKTISRIEAFQTTRVLMPQAHGRVDPNGKTFKKLLELSKKDASLLSLSDKAIELLKAIEQLTTQPYNDQTGEDITHWIEGATIGYGHLIAMEEWDKYKHGITEELALALLDSDLVPYTEIVKSEVTALINQHQFDALVIFTFNIGVSGFASSSVLQLVNDPAASSPYADLESAWKTWNMSQHKINQGLINRRQAEWDIYAKNIYKKW